MTRAQALTVAVSFAVVFIEEVYRETKDGIPGAADAAIMQLCKALEDVPSLPADEDAMCRCGHTAFWHADGSIPYCVAEKCDCKRFEGVPK